MKQIVHNLALSSRFLPAHTWRSICGVIREGWKHPFFMLKLVKSRLKFTIWRTMDIITTPEGIVLRNAQMLLNYWIFWIERETYDKSWVQHIQSVEYPTVVDVGGNHGLFSAWVFQTVREIAIFHIFEPLVELHDTIKIVMVNSWFNLRDVALGSSEGTLELSISRVAGTLTAGSDYQKSPEMIKVPLRTLDSYNFNHVDLLKIDVDGNEVGALVGGYETLKRTKFVIVECTSRDKFNVIRDILSGWSCKKVGAIDYLFENKTYAPQTHN